MSTALICSIVVTRGFLDFVSPPVQSLMFEVDSLASCYALAAEKWTSGKFMFSANRENGEYERFCGPTGAGCPKWPKK
jgi:hypothetical protein